VVEVSSLVLVCFSSHTNGAFSRLAIVHVSLHKPFSRHLPPKMMFFLLSQYTFIDLSPFYLQCSPYRSSFLSLIFTHMTNISAGEITVF
jgi:hypothetical protein